MSYSYPYRHHKWINGAIWSGEASDGILMDIYIYIIYPHYKIQLPMDQNIGWDTLWR